MIEFLVRHHGIMTITGQQLYSIVRKTLLIFLNMMTLCSRTHENKTVSNHPKTVAYIEPELLTVVFVSITCSQLRREASWHHDYRWSATVVICFKPMTNVGHQVDRKPS